MLKGGPRISAPQPPATRSPFSGRRGGTLTRPLPPTDEHLPPPLSPPNPPPPLILPPPRPPPIHNPPPPPLSSPNPPPPVISPRSHYKKLVQRPEIKAVVKIILPVELGAGFISAVGHTNMTTSEVIALAMTKFYKGQGAVEESEEMKTLIRNACMTLALSTDKAPLGKDELLADHMDPKTDTKQLQQMLKFEFKLVRTREVTEEERRAVEIAKQSKLAADTAAIQETKDKEAAELADAQDESKFEGPQTASIDELIARLLDPTRTPELEFRSAFCLNYVNFMSTVELLTKVLECYERRLPSDATEAAQRAFFKSKEAIVKFMRTWVEEYPEDFRLILEEHEAEFKERLIHLGTIDSVETDPVIKDAVALCGPTYKGLIDQIDQEKKGIYSILKFKVSRKTANFVPLTLTEYHAIDPPADRMGVLLTAPLEDIVAQFNRMDYNCLSMINMRELTNKWWTRKTVEKCPNVTRMIDIYNQRSYWVASACLTSPKAEERAFCISLFIKLTRALLNSHNYFGATAILNGLLQSPLGPTRIKATWDKVSANKKNMLEEIKVECDRKKNFAAYRTAYTQASFEGKPCIPNLVVVLQDLYQLEELPTVVEATGHINWHKYGKEWRQAQRVILKQIMQPAVHTKLPTPEQERESRKLGSVLSTVLTHCRLDEEQLWDLSYIHEAKSEEHKLTVQWKGYTPEQKQAMHEEELKKVWLVWGPILEARRQRFEKDRLLREEESAKVADAMKKLGLMRAEWIKDERKGGPPLSRSWNDPSHATDPHHLPDYLSTSRPSRHQSVALSLDDVPRLLSVDGDKETGTPERSLNESLLFDTGRDDSRSRRDSSRPVTYRTPLSPGGSDSSPENSVNESN